MCERINKINEEKNEEKLDAQRNWQWKKKILFSRIQNNHKIYRTEHERDTNILRCTQNRNENGTANKFNFCFRIEQSICVHEIWLRGRWDYRTRETTTLLFKSNIARRTTHNDYWLLPFTMNKQIDTKFFFSLRSVAIPVVVSNLVVKFHEKSTEFVWIYPSQNSGHRHVKHSARLFVCVWVGWFGALSAHEPKPILYVAT